MKSLVPSIKAAVRLRARLMNGEHDRRYLVVIYGPDDIRIAPDSYAARKPWQHITLAEAQALAEMQR